MKFVYEIEAINKTLEWLAKNEPTIPDCNQCDHLFKDCNDSTSIEMKCRIRYEQLHSDWMKKVKKWRERLWEAQAWQNNPK